MFDSCECYIKLELEHLSAINLSMAPSEITQSVAYDSSAFGLGCEDLYESCHILLI